MKTRPYGEQGGSRSLARGSQGQARNWQPQRPGDWISLLGHYSCQPVMEQLLEAHLHPGVLSLQRQPCPCRGPRSGWEREQTQPLSSRSPQGPATQRSQLSNSSDLDKKAQEGTRWVGLLTPLKIEHGFRGTVSQRNGLAQHSVSCQLNTNTETHRGKNSHSQGQGSPP